jgi:RimJ/RimL family protein N-acetyltransferase
MIETERLLLREWCDADVAPFHAICSDPHVMATLGPLMNREQTTAMVQRQQDLQARDGHCFWAMERRSDARLIGWCGLIRGSAGPIDGKAEIGWRLASDCWGHGYASEAARASLAWAFDNLADPAVWAITSVDNHRSRAVMERIGMEYVAGGDFDHPGVPEDSPLRRHVLYKAERPA